MLSRVILKNCKLTIQYDKMNSYFIQTHFVKLSFIFSSKRSYYFPRCMDNQFIYAHESILKQSSPYIDEVLLPSCDEIIRMDPFGRIVILMPDIDIASLKQALSVIYLGKSGPVSTYSEVRKADQILRTIFRIRSDNLKAQKTMPNQSVIITYLYINS